LGASHDWPAGGPWGRGGVAVVVCGRSAGCLGRGVGKCISMCSIFISLCRFALDVFSFATTQCVHTGVTFWHGYLHPAPQIAQKCCSPQCVCSSSTRFTQCPPPPQKKTLHRREPLPGTLFIKRQFSNEGGTHLLQVGRFCTDTRP
jgi:hypothetical protein